MAIDHSKVLGGTAIKPVERHGLDKIKYLLYNKDTGEVLTRTPKSWLLIFIFYVIYYSCLAAFWAAMLTVFFTTLNEDSPKWQGEDGLIGISPGLGLRPLQTAEFIDSSMILYNKNSEQDKNGLAGWGGWARRSSAFLEKYKGDAPANGKTCSATDQADKTSFCLFDVASLGSCASEGHGYDVGKPCIFLKLNRIYGLENEYYNDPADLPEEMPQHLKEHIAQVEDKDQVWVDCRPEYPADIEGIKSINYFPSSRGFPHKFFPYLNQAGYQSPVVAVQFEPLRMGQLLHIECRAWAKNIGYNRRDRVGIVHLEILLREE